jgi:hypothetical protein
MAKGKKKDLKPISRKKEIQQQLITQLSTSLPGLKDILGDKKFEIRIRKAAKLLSEGIKDKASKKDQTGKEDTSKKKAEPSQPAA